MSSQTIQQSEFPNKPIPLRVIFILNALMMFLPFVFYYALSTGKLEVGGLDPMITVYTGIAYIISFAFMVASILKRNYLAIRIIIAINVIIAIPAGAYIGIAIAALSFALTYNKKVKRYFLVD